MNSEKSIPIANFTNNEWRLNTAREAGLIENIEGESQIVKYSLDINNKAIPLINKGMQAQYENFTFNHFYKIYLLLL